MENDRRRGSRSRQLRLLAGILISSILVTAAGAGVATGATAVAATRAAAAPAAAPAARTAAATTSGRLWLTGHDADFHCSQSDSTNQAQCGYFKTALNYVRGIGTSSPYASLPVLVLDHGAATASPGSAPGEVSQAVTNAYTLSTDLTPTLNIIDPRTQFASTPLVDSSGKPLYSAIVVASDTTCGGCDNNDSTGTTPDSNAINARTSDIVAYYNAGGGILALAGAENRDVYYSFLPVPATAVAVSAPFTLTAAGIAVGLTDVPGDSEINCCATHNSFAIPLPGNPLQVGETDSSGFAETLFEGGALASVVGGKPVFGPGVQGYGITPTSGTHCTTVTITGTNFAAGVPVTPTLVYSSTSGITKTAPITLSAAPNAVGAFTQTTSIPTDVSYGTTAVFSVTAPYTVNISGGFPTFTVAKTPTVANSPVGPGLITGPLGPVYAVGQPGSLNITGSGGFLPNSPITLTLGLSGTAASVITTTGAITADATGAFTATTPYTPAVAGTYVLTATDSVTNCNVATTTLTVYPAPIPGPPVATQYFAEGYTGQAATNGKASYLTTLDVLNPNVTSVVVTTTYLLETINEDITTTTSLPDVVVVTHTLPALADVRINAASDISSTAVFTGPDAGKVVSGLDQKFAIRVDTAGFQGVGPTAGLGGVVRGVAVERTIERTATSGARDDGDVSLGTTAANTSYYFAEGYTGGNFQEYLLLFNPSPTLTATVQLVRVPEGGSTSLPPIGPFVLAPQQRLTLNMRRLNVDSSEKKIGLIVNSLSPNPNDTTPTPATPIVAERTEYFGPGDGSARPGETIGVGLTTAAKQLNFAYGSLTGTGDVASTITPTAELAQTQDDRPFVEVVNPNIAGQVIAGTLSGSATAPGPAAHVTIQLRSETGRLLGFFITDVDAGARFTLTYSDLTGSASGIGFPGIPSDSPTRAGVFSAVVSSSERVVSELAQYYGQGPTTPSGDANSGAPGLVLVGAPTGESDVLFPSLSETDPASTLPLSQTVFLYNPGVNPVRVNGTFYGPTGVLAHQVYTVGPDAIAAIGQGAAYSSGTVVGSSIPMGTTGAEFSTIQQRGVINGEPGTAPETFVAAAVTHSADASQWWGTQGLYPLPSLPVQ